LRVGTIEQRFDAVEIPNVECGTGRDNRAQAGRARYRERFFRLLPRLAVSALEQRDDRAVLLGAGTPQLLLTPPDANVARHLDRTRDDPDEEVQGKEAAKEQDEQQIERQLDPVRRRDQHRVAGVELDRERDHHRRNGEQKKPEEKAHEGSAAGGAVAGA